ncbi:MAG: response regulator transcription factor [Candidatus Cryptobacteroides sp.]
MTKKASILIAENKPFLADVIKESFGSGYDCICVKKDTDISENLDKADAAVVGLDVCSGDQKQRIDLIRSIRSSSQIPVLALTSIPYSAFRIELLKSGADDVMTKPFNPDELVVRVEKLMSRYR